jgi:hypothetical protein
MHKTVNPTSFGSVVIVEGDKDEVEQWCAAEKDNAQYDERYEVTVEFQDGLTRLPSESPASGVIPPCVGTATYVDRQAKVDGEQQLIADADDDL